MDVGCWMRLSLTFAKWKSFFRQQQQQEKRKSNVVDKEQRTIQCINQILHHQSPITLIIYINNVSKYFYIIIIYFNNTY